MASHALYLKASTMKGCMLLLPTFHQPKPDTWQLRRAGQRNPTVCPAGEREAHNDQHEWLLHSPFSQAFPAGASVEGCLANPHTGQGALGWSRSTAINQGRFRGTEAQTGFSGGGRVWHRELRGHFQSPLVQCRSHGWVHLSLSPSRQLRAQHGCSHQTPMALCLGS